MPSMLLASAALHRMVPPTSLSTRLTVAVEGFPRVSAAGILELELEGLHQLRSGVRTERHRDRLRRLVGIERHRDLGRRKSAPLRQVAPPVAAAVCLGSRLTVRGAAAEPDRNTVTLKLVLASPTT